jgi:alkaline phosphatase D
MIHRRSFLSQLSAFGLALAGMSRFPVRRRPRFAAYPFALGVASGDPSHDGVVLWTRIAPDPLRGGGAPPEALEVGWELAVDDGMRRIVGRGSTVAEPDLGHSVHVELDGLEPDRWYWYRFHVGGETSPVGRTRTLPPPGAMPHHLRFAFASCQHYEDGYYTAYRHMAAEELDVVVHLGDYIYEYGGEVQRVRMHTGGEVRTLDDYRNRYALYKGDPDLQAAHAAFPWIVTWDDHEVDNNYANGVAEDSQPTGAFLARRASAYQAYYEHLPLRRGSLPSGPAMQIYRAASFGGLARFFVLDTRQFRSDQPCGDGLKLVCPGVYDPAATLLGAEQEAWLFEGLAASDARWNVLAQQVLMARLDSEPGPPLEVYMDNWNGYDAARRRVLDFLATRRPANPVVLTGDIHSSWVCDLKRDFDEPDSPTVATELVGTSISSGGDGREHWSDTPQLLAENPWIRYMNSRRGYVRCEVTPASWRADYRVVEYVSQPDAPAATRASFVVEDGRPGAERA